jgi:hypothetical protein
MLERLKTPGGRIVLAIIIALGIASMFRMTCADGKCVVINGPSPEDIKHNVYKIESDCYKYTPYPVRCS